ncbi:selenocysteine-specific elongation factor [Melghiribacillus thermohalophilus]|uniref:Selenocysteine-specific elongation factor n=1 Tax=Melghiribacillus thermohalophilus TaxID=1324956 RepID=A0A4R3NGU1_9BACI|nr:selenocysteine-specific translation elongation factor [Melghiribacillus thermohalophilus]TCT26658.1 selenocysteine-specific elongation factor [Melghiribacillus thermohalophilus]
MKDERFYTIGMAGHIDHGKTALTKALTNIDTDRLKEEKERNISIEPGFAPLQLKHSSLNVSIIDVPGHEKFIRQMIAGVAGIDLVLLTVAADEGVMPQTKEHVDILSLLEIKHAIFVITKIDKVEQEMIELVEEEIHELKQQSSFQNAPIVRVDSISGNGISQLLSLVEEILTDLPARSSSGLFRLPVDQVFSLKGIGTVVRGTIYEGTVNQEEYLYVLPAGKRAKARQIQVHRENVAQAYAGQRTAINLAGIHQSEIKRGDVLVKSRHHFVITRMIDVSLKLTKDIKHPIKQRTPIKLHTATTEVFGRIVFFDRNEALSDQNEILCQLRLDNPVVVNRGDRFILRRATPVETIGGGWVMNPQGQKYKFGQATIQLLTQKKEGTPMEQILHLLQQKQYLSKDELAKHLSMSPEELGLIMETLIAENKVVLIDQVYMLTSVLDEINGQIHDRLQMFHDQHPMRPGMNKPELVQTFHLPEKVLDEILEQGLRNQLLKRQGQYVSLYDFAPHFPDAWKQRMESAWNDLRKDGIQVEEWASYLEKQQIPESLHAEFKQYVLNTRRGYELNDKYIIDAGVYRHALSLLYDRTGHRFSLKEAKEIWGISRKYLIPMLELADEMKYTRREEGDRKWIHAP